MLKCGIVGLGGLGKKHLGNILAMSDKVELVALCDVEKDKLSETANTNQGVIKADVDLTKYKFYTDAEEMMDKENLDFVICALPTYLHKKYAVMAMEKGIHAFSEKPMARWSEEAMEMIEVSKKTGKKLMIGQCLRFNNTYKILKEYYENGKLGKLLRANFHRFSVVPVWGWDHWYEDYEKSGCAAMDLHVHDVDLINWTFGRPLKVSSIATHDRTKFDSISTRYFYSDGLCVTADCDWGYSNSFGFRRGYTANFEKGALEMKDSGEVVISPQEGEAYTVALEVVDPYVAEMKDFIDAIENDREITVLAPESTKQTLEIVLAEIESAEKGEPVNL